MLAVTILFTLSTFLIDSESREAARPQAYRWIQRKVAHLLGQRAAANACLNNLRQIDGAKQQWALENQRQPGDVPTYSDIAPYLGRTSYALRMKCPRAAATDNFLSSYVIGAVTNRPKCRIMPGKVGHVLH
jgi:hypothetical protein